MSRANKYEYLFVVQGNYGFGHGWEDVYSDTDRRDARATLRDYRLNMPEYPHRLIQRRELRETA